MTDTKIFLFDIDYTLLATGGAGSRALTLAFQELFGIDDGFDGVLFAGRTDRAILREGLAHHGLLDTDGNFEAVLAYFRDVYHRILADTLPQTPGGRVLAGVPELLAALQGRPDALLGIATGNFRQGATMKLRYYSLDGYFLDGAYGDDFEERSPLVMAAAHNVTRSAGLAEPPAVVYVVGDTPHDVQAALAAGMRAIAVASGVHPLEELQAAGAHLVFPDLGDWRSVLAALLPDDGIATTHQGPAR